MKILAKRVLPPWNPLHITGGDFPQMPHPNPPTAEERRPRGRPPLPAEERRSLRSVVCLTATEATEIAEQAAEAGLAPAVYMRRRALGRPVHRATVRRLGAAELRELNRIGVNLNQIARALNAGAAASSGTRTALERCHEAVLVLLLREAEAP